MSVIDEIADKIVEQSKLLIAWNERYLKSAAPTATIEQGRKNLETIIKTAEFLRDAEQLAAEDSKKSKKG
ncbi:hypothetical protein AGMMS49975_22840 [Clostridia bacterium]|nr:hypothetical protein AGMMS49975_22840 [Clostridia bacterium]